MPLPAGSSCNTPPENMLTQGTSPSLKTPKPWALLQNRHTGTHSLLYRPLLGGATSTWGPQEPGALLGKYNCS